MILCILLNGGLFVLVYFCYITDINAADNNEQQQGLMNDNFEGHNDGMNDGLNDYFEGQGHNDGMNDGGMRNVQLNAP